jgi:hypothetical protein
VKFGREAPNCTSEPRRPRSDKVELITFNRSTRKIRHFFIYSLYVLNHAVTGSHCKYRALGDGLELQMEKCERTRQGLDLVMSVFCHKKMLADLGGQDSNSGPS